MTNMQFWKELEKIVKEPQDDVNSVFFTQLLLKAGDENLDVLVRCRLNNKEEGTVFIPLYGPNDRQQYIYCYSSTAKASVGKKHLESYGVCMPVSIRNVINTTLKNEFIEGLAFNYFSRNKYFITKDMLLRVIDIREMLSYL